MHMAHKIRNTSGVLKSSSDWMNSTELPERCVLMKKSTAVVFTNVTMHTYRDQLNTRFSKVCEICKVHGTDSLKHVQGFYTLVCYCGDIFMSLNMMRPRFPGLLLSVWARLYGMWPINIYLLLCWIRPYSKVGANLVPVPPKGFKLTN